MKITIDEKVCARHKMTIQEVLIALAIRDTDAFKEIPNMLKREILVEDKSEDWYKVTQRWSDVLDEILIDSEGNTSEDRLLNLAEQIRNIYPEGFKKDERTGTRYYHKSNKMAIKQALKRFIANWGDASDEDILDATRRYIASFRGNYKPPFQMANYFVCKDLRNKGGDITSTLATFLENKDEGEEEVINGDILANLV
jgi:hypothetical protein